MSLLKGIRRNPSINKLVRNSLNSMSGKSHRFFEYLTSKWWTSGVLDCEYHNTPFKIYNSCDDGIPEKIFYNIWEWHDHDLHLLMDLAKKANTIVDIGANTGVYTSLAALSNPEAKVYAFEPYSVNADRLKKNVALNDLKNVELILEAVGEMDGEIELSVPANRSVTQVSSVKKSFSENFGVKKEWEKIKVPITTIDTFGKKINKKIDLIKCDVETHEMSVFNGMKRILTTDKPTVIFESFLYEDRLIFFNNILKEFGYHAYFLAKEGLIHCNGALYAPSLTDNLLITTVTPSKPFINYKDKQLLYNSLMTNKEKIVVY